MSDRLRTERPDEEAPFSHGMMEDLPPRDLYPAVQDHDLMARIDEAVEALPPRERFVAERCLYEQLSNREVARMMNIDEKTVRNILESARARLQVALSPQEDDHAQ